MPAATSRTNPYQTQCLEPEPLSRYHPVINWNTASFWHYDVSNMSFFPADHWPRRSSSRSPLVFLRHSCLQLEYFLVLCGLILLVKNSFFDGLLVALLWRMTVNILHYNKSTRIYIYEWTLRIWDVLSTKCTSLKKRLLFLYSIITRRNYEDWIERFEHAFSKCYLSLKCIYR